MDTLQLVGSFGIALVTTIVGIAGRVLFVQLRSEIDDIEDRVRRDLAATSADLRAQLSSSVREFETVRTALVQTLNETVVECDNATRRQVQQVDERARLAGEQIKTAFEGNRREAERIASLVGTVAKTLDEASRRVATIELPTDHLGKQLGAFSRDLEALLQRLGAIIGLRRCASCVAASPVVLAVQALAARRKATPRSAIDEREHRRGLVLGLTLAEVLLLLLFLLLLALAARFHQLEDTAAAFDGQAPDNRQHRQEGVRDLAVRINSVTALEKRVRELEAVNSKLAR